MMKALVLKEYNTFTLEDVPLPECGEREVLIKVQACGICGSDVHGMDGSTGRRQPPIIMGHEASGTIASCGSAVTDWQPGDRVTFDSTVYCGECDYCREGRINLCTNRIVLGVSCDEYRQHGAFAEYVVVPEWILYRIPDGVSFAQAAMCEALSIAVHACARAQIKPFKRTLVVGAGMIGLLLIQTLKAYGAEHIIAVDVDEAKLAKAREYGADETILSTVPTDGIGIEADTSFEVVGIAPSLQTAINGTRKGGEIVLIGNLSPQVDFLLQQVVTREITLYGSCASSGEYPECLDLLSQGKVDVDSFISATAPLAEGNDWFQRLYNKEGNLLKVILTP